MNILPGLILFVFSFSAFAETSNGMLLLRAHVPASSRVEIKWQNKRPTSRIVSNGHSKNGFPKVVIEKKSEHYLVSVTHP